ncbi:MAG: type II toxin-antitoxin system PemK/MazF family toxin [archaeon]
MKLRRGEIVLVNLEPVKGSEQGKKRPAVVIQNDIGNRYSPTTIIAPLTSRYEENNPAQVNLEADLETGLEQDSTVLLNQIRTVSIEHRILKKMGRVSSEKMEKIDEALRISLDL